MNNTTTADELIKLSRDWMQAWKDNNMSFLESILAPDFRLVTSELWVMPREKWLATIPVYKCLSFEYKQQEIRDYGNTAIVQSYYSQTATLNGEDRSGDFLITDVWIKQNGNWKVVHRHTSHKK